MSNGLFVDFTRFLERYQWPLSDTRPFRTPDFTTILGAELAALVRHWLPAAQISFEEEKPPTHLIDNQDSRRLEAEIGFRFRPVIEVVRLHINEARAEAGLELI